MTYLVPFLQVEPDLAEKEMRTATLFGPREGIPAGTYGLVEFYCPDPDCDCRRVMLNVVEKQHPTRYLAAIGYGFDRDTAEAGPYLDPLNEQCAYADALLRLVQEVALSDPSYVIRLERHYERVKQAALDPEHPAYPRLRQVVESDDDWLSESEMDELIERPVARPAPRAVGRNDPCPCGSGKKYKRCCGRKRPIRQRIGG
jgi:hypothetical protein